MKKNRKFDDILNECIERILEGETAESCLADYPEYTSELKPLLLTVQDTRKAASVTPRPEFRQQAAYEFQTALHDLAPKKQIGFRWQVRFVTVISVIAVILIAGTSTVAAASNALPDELLYPVKLATEEVRLVLTPSALGKAELYAEFADRRVEEIIKMAEEGKVVQVVKVTERMRDQLVAVAGLSLNDGDTAVAEGESQGLMLAAPELSPTITCTPADTPVIMNVPAPVITFAAEEVVPSDSSDSAPQVSEKVSDDRAGRSTVSEIDGNIKKKETIELKIAISQQAIENKEDLQEVLERVSDDMKAALEKAIEVAEKGYKEALENIERAK